MSVIGDRIRDERIRIKVSQHQLARTLEVGQATVWRWEAGHMCPERDQIQGLAALFGRTVAWLTAGDVNACQRMIGQAEPLSALSVFVRLDQSRADVISQNALELGNVEYPEVIRRMIDFWRASHPSPPLRKKAC